MLILITLSVVQIIRMVLLVRRLNHEKKEVRFKQLILVFFLQLFMIVPFVLQLALHLILCLFTPWRILEHGKEIGKLFQLVIKNESPFGYLTEIMKDAFVHIPSDYL